RHRARPRRGGDGPRVARRRRGLPGLHVNPFETSGGAIAYHDEGSGPAVVLRHGFPLSSYLWRGLIPALAVRHRVLAPDLIGLGSSANPAGAAPAPPPPARDVKQ